MVALFAVPTSVGFADPFPPYWSGGAGAAIHFPQVQWPSEPDPSLCGASCGEWRPYTRFQNGVDDPRVQDPSNGGTAPQNYVNIASSCLDKTLPSIYYFLHQGGTPEQDVIMFRWRVEQIANTYATGPSPGNFGATDPWSSALWSVLFDVNGDGFIDLAAHLNGSSGAPATPIDMIAGIWSKLPTQSLDYVGDPTNVKLIAHNPTAFVDQVTNRILNFQNNVSPVPTWPNGAAETNWDYGTTRARLVSTSPCNEYFVDYQIPVAMLDASSLGGPKITRSSPISMLFCTANSLNNPFQKDCALNRAYTGAAATPGPFGDYVSFNQTGSYPQPIISSVTAQAPAGCPGSYALTAVVQDTLALTGGVVVPSVKAVSFRYYYDANGDGLDNDGNAWTLAADATLKTGSLNTWIAAWDASSLARGQYLIGVQAVDDNTKVDDGMTPSGVDNRTFSYVTGDSDNRITIGTTVQAGVTIPTHSPSIAPTAGEDWWGNPTVTGLQTALVGVALNTCGPAPTLTKSANPTSVAGGGTVDFTFTIANPLSTALTVSQISDPLPVGFSYVSDQGGTLTPTTSPGNGATGTVTWTFSPAASIPAGASRTLVFRTTAPTTAGNYNNSGTATTSFGTLTSPPVQVAVDSARVSLTKTPSVYLIDPDGSTQLTYTLSYANDSTVDVTNVTISDVLPSDITYVASSCTGGTSCTYTAGTRTVSWTIGTLAAGTSGSVTFKVTVDTSYSSSSLTNTGTLTGTGPGGSPVTKNASTTIAVNIPVAAFTLVKTASAVQVAPGGNVTWTITYTNYGTASAGGVTIVDTLPQGFGFSSCSNSCVNNGDGTATWTIGAVAAGASASVTITATAAAAPFTYPNPATNSATITWTGNPTGVTATSPVGVTGQYCSAVYYFHSGNVANQTAPTSGTDTTDTFSINNANPGSIVFTSPASPTALTISGQTLTINFFLSSTTGSIDFQVTLRNVTQNITIAQSASTTVGNTGGTATAFSFTAAVGSNIAQNDVLEWTFDFTVSGAAFKNIVFYYDSTTHNSRSSFCTASAPANLILAKTVDEANVPSGTSTPIVYTLTYANTGGTSATSTQIVDTLPANVSFVSSTPNPTSVNGQQLTYALGTVAAGGSGSITINATVGTSASGTLTNAATVSSAQTTDVTATADTTVGSLGGGGTAALAINKSADRSLVNAGETVTYTLTVVNTGTGDATNVQVSDTIPSTAYYAYVASSITGGDSRSDAGNPTLTWTINTLAVGASATLTFQMQAATSGIPSGVTTLDNSATATADGSIAATSNTVTVTLDGNPNLTLGKVATPSSGLAPGDTITYTLTVGNAGTSDATAVVVTDPVPSGTTFLGNITASQGTGAFDAVTNQVTFTVGTLASAASATLSFKVTVNSLPAGNANISNTATARAANAASRTADAPATATAAATLTLVKQAPAQVALPLATLTQAANGTTVFVNDTSQFTLGQNVSIGGAVRQVTGITGNTITVDASVSAAAGTGVIGAITYGLSYQNTGNATATSVTLTDTLPAGATFVSASNGGSQAAGVVTWNLGDVAAGGGGAVQLVIIPGGAGTHTNNASITCSACPPVPASAVTTAGGLVVRKRTTTPTSVAGGTAVYIIDVENTSGSAIGSVTVTDTLASGFSYASTTSVLNDGVSDPATTSPVVGDIVPTWGTFTIQAGKILTITFVADIAATVGAATYQNPASATPAGSTVPFDPLTTTAEDVTVLASGTGAVQGYVFRDDNNNGTFEPDVDTALTGVSVAIVDSALTQYTLTTDSSGHFIRVVVAGNTTVDLTNGDIPGGLVLGAGFTDPGSVNVPGGGIASKDTAYVPDGIVPDLTIAKSHAGDVTQGQTGATYSLTVTNGGPGPTSGTVTVVDTLPTGLSATGLAGTGWNCTLGTLTCTRSDALPATQSYPAITLTVDVAAGAPASVTNTAVVSGGGETNTTNNSASDPTTVGAAPRPDLTIAKSHSGDFTQGQTGVTYTLTVSNAGSGATTGTVTVTDTLPAGGLTATGLAGSGWSCVLATLTCTRGDSLGAGLSYPVITITVTVASDAPTNLTNGASVSGGGDANPANNSASDPTVVGPFTGLPDVTIAKSHAGSFTRGQTGATYTMTVTNVGPTPTAGLVTVADTLPAGLTATAITGSGWSCVLGTLTCSRSDALGTGASYPGITVTVNVANDAGTSLINTAAVSGGGESNTTNNFIADPTTVAGLADLAIAKTHAGNFIQGQAGAVYSIVVTNVGAGPTAGTVTVTETLPTGLGASSLAGAGWSCEVMSLTCTRSDVLPPGQSYPAIAVTVSVAFGTPAYLANTVTVSGGGDTDPANNTATDLTIIDPPAPIPTLGGWAFLLLAMGLAATAVAALKRRRRPSTLP